MRLQQKLSFLKRNKRRFELKQEQLKQALDKLTWFRLGLFFGTVILTIICFSNHFAYSWFVLLTGFILFSLSVFMHKKVKTEYIKITLYREFFTHQIARLEIDWSSLETPYTSEIDKSPVSRDLNLSGKNSLHHLIDICISQEGSQLLKEWLISPQNTLEELHDKQVLVKELRPKTRFRTQIILKTKFLKFLFFGIKKRKKWQILELLNWFEQSFETNSMKKTLYILSGLSFFNLLSLTLYFSGYIKTLIITGFILYVLISIYFRKFIVTLFNESVSITYELSKLYEILALIENFEFPKNSHLKHFFKPIQDEHLKPSKVLKKLSLIVSAASLQRNFIIWGALNIMVPWDFFFSWYLASYKREIEPLVKTWLKIIIELDALQSLANFAYLNPENVFPEISNDFEAPLRCSNLGHPLIQFQQRICNSFEIEKIGQINLITGSNMAGKSTFLRTIGINMALSLAGGTVHASSFKSLPLQIFTCINVSDSLKDGFSYFHAEVRRLKHLMDLLIQSEGYPVLYLVDEIFRGTNNRERLIGSQSFIKAISDKEGCGLISTHDLELIKMEEVISEFKNYHFKEKFIDNKMIFDYQILAGPCSTTNALKVMKMEGLPISYFKDL